MYKNIDVEEYIEIEQGKRLNLAPKFITEEDDHTKNSNFKGLGLVYKGEQVVFLSLAVLKTRKRSKLKNTLSSNFPETPHNKTA